MTNNKQSSNIHEFNPSDCISGKMMRNNRIVANVFRKHLKQFNITDSQLSIIFVASKVKSLNQRKISELLHLEKSTVNRNIARLLDNEIISSSSSKELALTKKGRDLLNNILPHWRNAMAEIESILEADGVIALNLVTRQLTS
ncbi:MAG: MarR family winged helix-turn-helix transcriptional regulator [Crocinitomicaceae bacterium]